MKLLWVVILAPLLVTRAYSADVLRLPKNMTLKIGANTQVMDGDIALNLTGIPIRIEDPSTYREYQDLDMITTVLADVDMFKHMERIPAFILRSKGLRNAFAGVYDHLRIVVFDPDYIWDLNDAARAQTIRAFAFGHEFGHHYCGHIESGPSPPHELEADQFAGALMRKGEVLNEQVTGHVSHRDMSYVLTQIGGFLPATASATHPGSADRVQAIAYGYAHGSPCLDKVIKKRVQ